MEIQKDCYSDKYTASQIDKFLNNFSDPNINCDHFFVDSLLPLVVSTPKQALVLQTKKNEWEKIELKLDTGLDRYIQSYG